MKPGINFFVPPGNHPLYSFIVTIGILPDLMYAKEKYQPSSAVRSAVARSAWFPVLQGSLSVTLLPDLASSFTETPASPFSLVLSAGICFGTIGINNEIEQVKKAGAAKILAME